jgi:pyridinium-3,5-biscarboxylic acid mononucleotide sulfurtransferase
MGSPKTVPCSKFSQCGQPVDGFRWQGVDFVDNWYERLKDLIRQMDGAVVAFSGGVDSTVLLAAAHEALGQKALAVTALSPTYSQTELARSRNLANAMGARHLVIKTAEFEHAAYRANPPNRCYFCKRDLFERLKEIASQEGLSFVLDGSNADDLGDFRPGREAAKELGVRAPFVEIGVGKTEIRRIAKELGLPNWNQPSQACLASRIPYGEEITLAKLNRIERTENALRSLGLRQVRVRDYSDLARIEIARDELDDALLGAKREQILNECKAAGYTYVCVDLEGYRSGAMNEALTHGGM